MSLRGRPVGVQQNMEVAAVNYEAREFGLYNRISVAQALRLCPHLVLVRGDNGINAMQRYRHVSLPCTLAHPLFALIRCPQPVANFVTGTDWPVKPCSHASCAHSTAKTQRFHTSGWVDM